MLWFGIGLIFIVLIVWAGRAHSRYLDWLDEQHASGFLNDQKVRFFARPAGRNR